MTATSKFTKAQQAAIDEAIADQTARREAADKAAADHQAEILAAIERENAKPVSDASFRETIGEFIDNFELPSGTRVIISLVAGVILGGVAGYMGVQLTAMMVAYAATLTGSAFLVFMVQFIAYALTFIGSLYVGGKLQAVILDGSIDRGFSAAKSWVGGLFGSATKTVAA